VKISIILPAFNEERLIVDTLRQVRVAAEAFTHRGWETELIVCDNNSTDKTAELAKGEGALVVFEPVNQIARARNRGAAAATGEWLLFIDADSHPSRELLAEVADQIASGECLAGGSAVVFARPTRSVLVAAWVWNSLSRLLKWMAGAFIFVETQAFRQIGGFNQDFYIAEEIDLSQRLKLQARSRKRKIVILQQYPLVTSSRKLHLYSGWDYTRFLFNLVLSLGRSKHSRSACFPWYDGRR
jgi:glycosyltransferase involved in cell wall biosynthesis